MIILKILWWVFLFVVFWAMVGYPVFLVIIGKIFRHRKNRTDASLEPTVTIMVVAHNEEKVIREKLENLLAVDYPPEKLEILVASDCSTDHTNEIVRTFMSEHPEKSIRLHESVNHFGKTNAQNEAQELCRSEILVMTDANAMLDKGSVRELVGSFTEKDIAYVCGQLQYRNTAESGTAESEGIYWKLDLLCREIESRMQTITAGNGAIYAVRNKMYEKIPPIECHDFSFPLLYALKQQRAIYNPRAIAVEKAGESSEDEFKRKVRMNRTILHDILPTVQILNIFKYRWFSVFYFGHRTCRYSLWIAHTFLLLLNLILLGQGVFWWVAFGLQLAFYGCALLTFLMKKLQGNRICRMIFYYCMTVLAQWKAVINILTGKVKPVWEKAESTR